MVWHEIAQALSGTTATHLYRVWGDTATCVGAALGTGGKVRRLFSQLRKSKQVKPSEETQTTLPGQQSESNSPFPVNPQSTLDLAMRRQQLWAGQSRSVFDLATPTANRLISLQINKQMLIGLSTLAGVLGTTFTIEAICGNWLVDLLTFILGPSIAFAVSRWMTTFPSAKNLQLHAGTKDKTFAPEFLATYFKLQEYLQAAEMKGQFALLWKATSEWEQLQQEEEDED